MQVVAQFTLESTFYVKFNVFFLYIFCTQIMAKYLIFIFDLALVKPYVECFQVMYGNNVLHGQVFLTL